jgi:predicted metal-dependent enzyme (double-stranded beta helix superfamily)
MDIESFISKCQDFIRNPHANDMCYQLMLESMTNLSAVQESLEALHPQERPEDAFLFRSPNLFIFNSFLIPHLISPPHTHGTWAVVGLYEGQEDNIFYTRNNGNLAETGRKSLTPGEVALLTPDTIHAVSNPSSKPSLALHVYGADLFSTPRSMWNPWTMEESPFEINQFLTCSLTMMQQGRTSHVEPHS